MMKVRTSATPKELLTHSRMSCAKTCLRKHHYRYVLGITSYTTAAPLRFGGNAHLAWELWSKGATPEEAINRAIAEYDNADDYELQIERITLATMLAGYFWYYRNDNLIYEEVEGAFQVPLINPATGRSSRSFKIAGVRDGIVRLGRDGRLFLLERKTTKEDIGDGSDYWLRLRLNSQIRFYVNAARQQGYDINDVLYDAMRKPTIEPHRATPKEKLKYKKDGELYAYCRLENEPPDNYGDRLFADITERPEFYYQRREVPMLHDELAQNRKDAWATADMLRQGYNFANDTFMCRNCDFYNLCLQSISVDLDNIPAGFKLLEKKHPELEENGNGNNSTTDSTATTTDS